MPISNDGAAKVFDGGLFGADVHLSLHESDPQSGDADELSGGSYARVTLAAATDFTVSGKVATFPAAKKTFPTPTNNWANPTHWALYDSATAGKLLFSGAITGGAVDIEESDTVFVNANGLSVTLS